MTAQGSLTEQERIAASMLRPEYQGQLDADGCFVSVSRQALDETMAALDRLTVAPEPRDPPSIHDLAVDAAVMTMMPSAGVADPAKTQWRALDKIYRSVFEFGVKFREYETLHRAKNTDEGREKAQRNKVMADRCEECLGEISALANLAPSVDLMHLHCPRCQGRIVFNLSSSRFEAGDDAITPRAPLTLKNPDDDYCQSDPRGPGRSGR